MTDKFEIIPSKNFRVIDLVEEAGLDVSDWSNYRGRNPATNPKYCYEWAFQGKDLVVLNLWQDDMSKQGDQWIQSLNPRSFGRSADGTMLKQAWFARATKFENAISTAYSEGFPVRVIVCAGKRRKIGTADTTASQVKNRALDATPWAVTSYNPVTGACIITRGATPDKFEDQFSLHADNTPAKRLVSHEQYDRSEEVRRQVRERARGHCELCGKRGFIMENGKTYIETHHVVPLFEKGPDKICNVVALCPNHHKEAHFSQNKKDIRERLTGFLKNIYGDAFSAGK